MPNQASVQIMDPPSPSPDTVVPVPNGLSKAKPLARPARRPGSATDGNTRQLPAASVNRDRTRPITVAVDRTVVRIPRIGEGSVSQQLFDQVEAVDQAFILALIESVIAGSATRMVRSIVREMCGATIPVTLVQERGGRLDRSVRQWNERSLAGQEYPFLFLTSGDVSIRHQGATHRHSTLIAAAITDEGYREVLGIDLTPTLPRSDWARFLSTLKRRGLRGVDLLISANEPGLASALQLEFPQALWQRSQDGTSQAVLSVTPTSLQFSMKDLLKRVFDSSSLQVAVERVQELEDLETQAPEAIKELSSSLTNALSITNLPSTYRTRLRTTRLIDRVAQDVQRRAHIVRVFPSHESVVRLVGTTAMRADHSWLDGQRYFSMEPYRAWRKSLRSMPAFSWN